MSWNKRQARNSQRAWKGRTFRRFTRHGVDYISVRGEPISIIHAIQYTAADHWPEAQRLAWMTAMPG